MGRPGRKLAPCGHPFGSYKLAESPRVFNGCAKLAADGDQNLFVNLRKSIIEPRRVRFSPHNSQYSKILLSAGDRYCKKRTHFFVAELARMSPSRVSNRIVEPDGFRVLRDPAFKSLSDAVHVRADMIPEQAA